MAKRVGVDKWMFFTTLLLVVAGLAMVFSASAIVAQARYHTEFADLGRQAGWAVAGVLAMLWLMHVDATRYNSPRFIYPALSITTLLLVRSSSSPARTIPTAGSVSAASSPSSRRRLPSRAGALPRLVPP